MAIEAKKFFESSLLPSGFFILICPISGNSGYCDLPSPKIYFLKKPGSPSFSIFLFFFDLIAFKIFGSLTISPS